MKQFISDISQQSFPEVEKIAIKTIRPSILALLQKDYPTLKINGYLSIQELNVYRQKYAGALVTSAQSLKALTALSSEVTATFPNRSQIVTETDRPFLVWLRDRFLAYGEQSGATTESLYIRSIGRLHSGSISLSLGDLALAETQLTEAQRTLLTLQAVSPVDVFDQCLAQCCALLGECQLAQGQPDLAIRHFEEALIRFDKFLAGPRARPLLEVRLHRAALLNSLAALHPDGPASEAMQPEWDASRQHLEELFLAGDQKLDVGIVLVETLRLQAQRQKPSPENQAARSLLERARDVTGEMLTLDPRHQRVRFQRAQTLCELSLLIPEQVEQLTTESIQILSVLVTESPAHAPFRQQLSRVLEARYVLRNASGDVNGAAADHELAALLLLPEVSPPEASRAILTKLQTDLTSPRQVLLGGNHTHADVLLEQLIPQIREAVPSHPAGERSVRLVVDALQLRAEVKSYLNQWPEAEALLAEALAAIDSLVQDRRSRLLFAQLRAELSHRRAQILISLHREAEAEPLRALSRAFLEELDLDLTEESLVALHRPVDRGVTGPPSLTTGDQFEDPAGVRSAVDQQRQALMGALEVMRMQFVKANLLPDAGVVWERQQRLTRDALQTQFHNLTFPEPEQGLSPAHWVLDEQGITYVEVQGSTSGFVWGAGPYSDDSDLGTAAVHAGYLQPGEFKFVGIRRRHAQPQFSSSTANGVTTNHSVRFSGSYEIVGAGLRDTLFYGEERSPDAKRFTVLVRGDAGGYAYGTDLYSTDSELSAAAVHLGILQPLELSFIDIEILPGQEKYTGSTRHGLTTRDNGPWHSTFRLSRPSRYRNEPSP